MKLATLFGRPNVGKSTLFNRIVGGRPAIVHSRPGSTRDGRLEVANWRGRCFRLHDTGGAGAPDAGPFASAIRSFAERTAARSDLVVFVVDCRTGVTAADQELAEALRRRRHRPPILLAANKAEGIHEAGAAEFHALGLGNPHPVSAEHGLGVADLLDRMLESLHLVGGEPESAPSPVPGLRAAIVGRANVGKSTLLNRFAGYERALVSPVAGTTRDPVDERIEVGGREVVLVDTAGIRRSARRRPMEDFDEADALAVLMARKAIARADLALLMLDAVVGPTTRDAAIARLIEDAGCGVVVLGNRWDLVTARAVRWPVLRREVRERLRHIGHAPLLRLSAATGKGVGQVWKAAFRVETECRRRIPTPEVNRFLAETAARFAPRSRRGREVKLLYGYQSATAPPRFRIFTNCPPRDLLPSYPRFLVGALRRRYGFGGTPIRLRLIQRSRQAGSGAASRLEIRPGERHGNLRRRGGNQR